MSRDSWATPMPVYLALDVEFDFKADICASDHNAKHPLYLTQQDDALANWEVNLSGFVEPGDYVWCNCPYSGIAPWIALANQLKQQGIGTVMLVMADSSVAWYAAALELCSEVREVIRGRIAFLNPETGQPVSGNSKGSLLLIFDPYGRQSPPRRTYIERDQLLADGYALMSQPELLFPHGSSLSSEQVPLSPEHVPLSPELEPVSSESAPLSPELGPLSSELPAPAPVEPEPKTEFTPDDLYHLYQNGELKADHFPTFLAALVLIFGERERYHIRQLRGALVAEASASAPPGEDGVNIGLSREQLDFIGAVGRCLPQYGITEPDRMVTAIAELVAKDAMRSVSISEVLTRFRNKAEEAASCAAG